MAERRWPSHVSQSGQDCGERSGWSSRWIIVFGDSIDKTNLTENRKTGSQLEDTAERIIVNATEDEEPLSQDSIHWKVLKLLVPWKSSRYNSISCFSGPISEFVEKVKDWKRSKRQGSREPLTLAFGLLCNTSICRSPRREYFCSNFLLDRSFAFIQSYSLVLSLLGRFRKVYSSSRFGRIRS